MGSLLTEVGLPFLARFADRDAIVTDWVRWNDDVHRMTRVARLDVALILLARGDVSGARASFAAHAAADRRDPRNPDHAAYVRDLARGLGLGELD